MPRLSGAHEETASPVGEGLYGLLCIAWPEPYIHRKVEGEKALVMTDPVLEGCTDKKCDYVVYMDYEL